MLEDLEFKIRSKLCDAPYSKTIRDYTIKRKVGAGGFSIVHEAYCRKTGFRVAIKLIEKNLIIKRGLSFRVLQEINIQSQLNHPSVLKLYTAFEDETYVYLVLEFCAGSDLKNLIERNAIHINDVINFMKQITQGLEYVHSQKIVHRDIKLANILLTDGKQIKIADFGLSAKIEYRGQVHMTMCGTPNYIPPEIVNKKNHGFEADLWSLGCLLYTLLVGRPPFETDSNASTLSKITSGTYFMPPCTVDSAQDLIRRLLEKDPNNRITLKEVKNHPFLTEVGNIQKWVPATSEDSGCGTGTYSGSSNCTSSKCPSMERKISSDYSSKGYGSLGDSLTSNKKLGSCGLYSPTPQESPYAFDPDYVHHNNYLTTHRSSKSNSGHRSNDKEYKHQQNLIFPTERCLSENEAGREAQFHCESGNSNYKSINKGKCSSRKTDYSASSFNETDEEFVPINTERLKPQRITTKHTVTSILENGDICVECLEDVSEKREMRKKKMVVEVIRISKNGLKMYIYYPNNKKGVPLDSKPPPMPLNGPDITMNCDTLTKKYMKKYKKASQFVEIIKAKTPKITLYTPTAKCVLMENQPDPDFELAYNNGKRIIRKSQKGIIMKDTETNLDYQINLETLFQSYNDNLPEYAYYFEEVDTKKALH